MQLPIIHFLFFLGIFHFCISKIDMDSKYFANSTEMRKKAKEYDKECMRIYRNSKRQEEMICDHMEANIKSLEQLKNKYVPLLHKIDNGTHFNLSLDELLDLRADIEFGMRNTEIIIKRLKKAKVNCFKDTYEMSKYFNEIEQKNTKNKEELINAVNHILQMENGL